MSSHHYVACDLGAESCRVMLGSLTNGQLVVEEVHRFVNAPVTLLGTLRWDVIGIFNELKIGLHKAAIRGHRIESMSTDSWGVDYVYLRAQEPLLTPPYHYLDRRTDGLLEKAFAIVPAELIYSETGIQFLQLNTLYQLLADLEHRREILELSDQFLSIADYFNYLFCGAACAEESIASTTQLFNPRERRWSKQLIEKFQLPARIFPKIVHPGTNLGPLSPAIEDEIGLRGTQVVASCSHDTAAAVAAVPAEGREWAYLSSGTWSLLGVELHEPIIDAQSLQHNFANEIGYGGTIGFHKDILGLWIVQECRRQWANEGREYTYEQLTMMAEQADPLRCLINPTALRFARPDDMPRKISNYCRETNQMPPRTPGETVRCVLESLALLYCHTLREIATVTGQKVKYVHIVGGGSKNWLLNQLTADATQSTVLAGPSEATAIGNILIQAIALGHLDSLTDLRQVVRRSFVVTSYRPRDTATWREAYERFQELKVKS